MLEENKEIIQIRKDRLKQKNLVEVIKCSWSGLTGAIDVMAKTGAIDVMANFSKKLKRLRKVLKKWEKDSFEKNQTKERVY